MKCLKSSIDRRLSALEETLKTAQPCVMTVKLTTGETVTTDAVEVWDFFKCPEKRDLVASITANRDDYAEVARLVEVLCGCV